MQDMWRSKAGHNCKAEACEGNSKGRTADLSGKTYLEQICRGVRLQDIQKNRQGKICMYQDSQVGNDKLCRQDSQVRKQVLLLCKGI